MSGCGRYQKGMTESYGLLVDRVSNENIRERKIVTIDILDTIRDKRLNWYEHLRRMSEKRYQSEYGNRNPKPQQDKSYF